MRAIPAIRELRYLSLSWRPLQTAQSTVSGLPAARGAFTPGAACHALERLIVDGSVYDEDVDTGSTAKPPLFRPVVDGWVIPLDYGQPMRKGTQNTVDFLAGNKLHHAMGPELRFRLPVGHGAGEPGLIIGHPCQR